MKASTLRTLVFAAAVSPLGAVAIKAPGAIANDAAAADMDYMRALLMIENAQTNELRRIMDGFRDNTRSDRQAVQDRQSLIQLARDRQRRLIEALKAVCNSNQQTRVKVLEGLWERLDGEVIWIVERCGLTESQGIRVGGLLVDFRESRLGAAPDAKMSLMIPRLVVSGFPTGRVNAEIEKILTPAQRSLYRELRQEQEQALAAAMERSSSQGPGGSRGGPGGGGMPGVGGGGMPGGGMPGGGFPGGGRGGF